MVWVEGMAYEIEWLKMADTSKTSYFAAFFNGDSEKLNVKFKKGLEQDFQLRREIHFKTSQNKWISEFQNKLSQNNGR